MRAVLDIIMILLNLATWVLIIQAVLSWLLVFNILNSRSPLVYNVGNFLDRLTEPALRPLRRVIPSFSGVDFSPLALLLLIFFAQRVIVYYVYPNVI